jgi:hypothetical protein
MPPPNPLDPQLTTNGVVDSDQRLRQALHIILAIAEAVFKKKAVDTLTTSILFFFKNSWDLTQEARLQPEDQEDLSKG